MRWIIIIKVLGTGDPVTHEYRSDSRLMLTAVEDALKAFGLRGATTGQYRINVSRIREKARAPRT